MIDQDSADEAVCSTCKRRVMQGRVARDEHDDCEAPLHDTVRQAEAIRRLHRDTAALLHRHGQHEEAAYHELRAGRP